MPNSQDPIDERNHQRRQPSLIERMTDQAVGAFLAVLIGGLASWIWGLGDLKRDVSDHSKLLTKIEVHETDIKRDVDSIKMEVQKVNSEMDKRVSIMEHDHRQIEDSISAHDRGPLKK